MNTTTEGHVPEHAHDEYVTVESFGQRLSSYVLSGLALIGSTVIAGVVYVVVLSGQVHEHSSSADVRMNATDARLEEVRREGSLPLRELRHDLDSLRLEMRALTAELRRVR